MGQLAPDQAIQMVEKELVQRRGQKESTDAVLAELGQARSALLPLDMDPTKDPLKFLAGPLDTAMYHLISAQMMPLSFNLNEVTNRIAELEKFLKQSKSLVIEVPSIPRSVDPRRHRS